MKKYVIDSNILFSMMITQRDVYSKIFSETKLYTSDMALIEIDKYKTRILKKSNYQEDELKEFIVLMFERLVVIPRFFVSDKNAQRAVELCKDIDPKDAPFVALSLELDVPLLTRDKELHGGLKDSASLKIELFSDFVESFRA